MSNFTEAYPPLTAADFETQYDADHRYIFVEAEDGGTLFTFGHDRDAEFALQANEFDIEIGGLHPEDAIYTALDVEHIWAITREPPPEWCFHWRDVTEGDPGAFPVSILWR